jgi:hypothetical protein
MGKDDGTVIEERMDARDGNARAAIEAGYRIGELESADVIDIAGVPHVLHKAGMSIESAEKLLPAPTRVSETRRFRFAASFCDYVTHFMSESARVYGAYKDCVIYAVLDDHFADAGKMVHPRWCEHVARLELEKSEDWKDLEAAHKKWVGHVEFVEFLQDHIGSIADPDASTIIESASAFSAHRGAKFEQVVSASGGDLEVAYSEEVRGNQRNGTLPMPRRILFALQPFCHGESITVEALVRWRLPADGKIVFSLTVLRLRDEIEREFARTIARVENLLGMKVLV